MKLFLVLAMMAAQAVAQAPKTPATLKSTLMQELRETHDQKNWFVSSKEATAGLTPEQAAWADGKGNHSVGQLTYHLAFWNQHALETMKGGKPKSPSNNDTTFTDFDAKHWDETAKHLDQVMKDIEAFVEQADDATVAKVAPTIASICAHNAYHIGEMIVVRKEQGVWNPETGVK